MSWVTSLRLPPVSSTASGTPPASVIRWCLEPSRPRSTGLRPVFGPPLSARTWLESTTARERSSFPAGSQFGEQNLVQTLPEPGVVPVA